MMDENDPATRLSAGPAPDWVFGYGSLMWRPGFAWTERRRARLEGWRRSFCLRSIRYRGTPEAPGLVLGLDAEPGAVCDGVAYRPADPAAARDYLRERELVTYAYREAVLPVALETGAVAAALTYVIDPEHAQYAGGLSCAEQAAIIARAAGPMGPNAAYLASTMEHLAALGVRDAALEALHQAVLAEGARA